MGLREKNGKWEYRFIVKGQFVQVATGLEATERNQKKALDQESAHRQAIREGRWGIQPLIPRSFSNAKTEFIDWCKVEYRNKPNSWRRIQTSMASCGVFFDKFIVSMITPGDVERYKVWRATGDDRMERVRDVTIKHDLDNLSVFFHWAVKCDYARQNPTKEVDRPSDSGAVRQRVLTDAEEKLYFQTALSKFTTEKAGRKSKHGPFQNLHDLGRLMILQGCRPEEVMVIAKKDVNLAQARLRIPEGKTPAAKRSLKLTQESVAIFGRRMLSPGPWIFPSSRRPGKPITKLNGPHDSVCLKIGIEFVIYDLRHTFATRMIEAGATEWAVAAILGHSSTRVLHRYVHPSQEHQDAAMEVYDGLNEARGKGAIQ